MRAPEGFSFPMPYPLKAAGRNTPALEVAVVEIVRRHAPDFDPTTVTVRESRGGHYVSITVTLTATSREQLDALYRELTAHPDILWVL
ncbi:MAG: DUF493 domain-containing protein [Casimicrobiaceae bacterium]|nr:DUF493 domain-containing protein [Casimicrobiaceae bacterium]MCX8097427.1 DUF493 domain-containing protein [Casimicrobiaceae bacterium]MDW8312061.1 DUF493 domain-containing protein [Burkholderiales bacterium]